MAEINVNFDNPIVQFFIIVIGIFIVDLFFGLGILKWILGVMLLILWAWYHFINKGKEGAVKG